MDRKLLDALRTLRGIRQRYDTGRSTGSSSLHAYTVHVALGPADMPWIAAVIEALEEADNQGVELKSS